MPIKQTIETKVQQYIEDKIKNVEAALIRELSAIGEQVVNTARESGSYTDQTGNLRSSVGYVIVKDGQVVLASSFAAVKDGGNGSETGRSYAESLASRFSNGIALIVVAGMQYAAYVKRRGKDVIDSAELLADNLVPKLFRELNLSTK
ncbi:MAG: hypothetical protein MJY71_02450 [Bacteroidaceae bacterium]|nr:hypothetical protein [Bacteroidaceae bacterium]